MYLLFVVLLNVFLGIINICVFFKSFFIKGMEVSLVFWMLMKVYIFFLIGWSERKGIFVICCVIYFKCVWNILMIGFINLLKCCNV